MAVIHHFSQKPIKTALSSTPAAHDASGGRKIV